MGRRQHLSERLANHIPLAVDAVPAVPIVEVAGESRVLIENHQGVAGYGRERIIVKVHYGYICVNGCHLELTQMTKEQLIICGKIDSVTLQRRN